MDTIKYYDKNAERFIDNTVGVDFSDMQKKFLSYLPISSLILDFGCGSGRDTKFFADCGYLVEAIDGSEVMCRYAEKYTGIKIKQMLFQDLDEQNKYDGIWACSSILHLSYDDLVQVMEKIAIALKPGGIIYTSFKYGTYEGERNGRYFIDMTEEKFLDIIYNIEELSIEEQWITLDVRSEREDERWLNLILRKN